jgi:uncharacterized phiE125 gp8 family phage protein
MKLTRLVAPTGYPITLDELKAHLRYVEDDQDTYFQSLIQAATDAAENQTWRRFLTQTWQLNHDWFVGMGQRGEILLPYPPAQSIVSIQYIDTSGVLQTVNPSIYRLSDQNGLGWIQQQYLQIWPVTRGWYDDTTIVYVCGYGAPADVPDAIKHAIKIHAQAAWEGTELPKAFCDLLSPYSVVAPDSWKEYG